MTSVMCNLCRSNDYTVLFESGKAQINQIVKCNCCGLMYANPRAKEVDAVEIEKYSPDWVRKKTHFRFDKEKLQIRDYKNTQAFLNKSYPQKGRLVEVGSGLGYLLNFFKQDGWDVVGIEPNLGGCQYTEKEFGIKAIATTLENAELKEQSVDIVLMMHVIEHVPDPFTTFKEVYRILKPGGIFILETPRYDTLMFRLLKHRERSLSCDGHIYFFTASTLAKMANNAGFTKVKLDYVGRSLTLDRLIWNLGVISKSKSIQNALQGISNTLHFNKISLYLNFRDMQRLYLQKPS